MTNGSRWFIPLYEGLIEPEHVAKMGKAIWLYLYGLKMASIRSLSGDKSGAFDYSAPEVAEALGLAPHTVRKYFQMLQEARYFETRARHSHYLEVAIVNWRTVEEWLEARDKADVMRRGLANERLESAVTLELSDAVIGKLVGTLISTLNTQEVPTTNLIKSLRVQGLPKGAKAPESGPETIPVNFAEWQKLLKSADNQPAALRFMFCTLFPEAVDKPSYGYLGRVARQVGGAGRLAELMWQLAARPPTGDALAYIQAMAKRRRSDDAGRDPMAEAIAILETQDV